MTVDPQPDRLEELSATRVLTRRVTLLELGDSVHMAADSLDRPIVHRADKSSLQRAPTLVQSMSGHFEDQRTGQDILFLLEPDRAAIMHRLHQYRTFEAHGHW